MIQRLLAWGETLGKRLSAHPKVHVIDSGLAGWLLGLSAAKINSRNPAALTEFGHLVETFAVGEVGQDRDIAVALPEAGGLSPGLNGSLVRNRPDTSSCAGQGSRISAQTARWSLPGMKCTEYLSTAQLRSTRTWSRVSRALLPGRPQVGLSPHPVWAAASA
jgi:hypothetical protein